MVALSILLIGANHRSSSLALRDQVYVNTMTAPRFLRRLAENGIPQAVILSTNERVEVIAFSSNTAVAAHLITNALAEQARLDHASLASQLYYLSGLEAVRHCFAVAAALDSLVIGESCMLSQLKEAHHIAQSAGTSGDELDSLLIAACRAARRVRTETGIAEWPVSIASVAVQLARHLHGDLVERQVLLIGTGDMGGLVASSLREAGVRRFVVTTPRAFQAEAIASTLGGHIVPFTDLAQAMVAADIALSSVSGRRYVLETDLMRQVLRRRRQKPIFIIDIGIPGDVEPTVNQLDNAFLYDLNDLEQVAMAGRISREIAARTAWDIITSEVTVFLKGRTERSLTPVLQTVQQYFETVRVQVISEVGSDVDKATRLLVTRLLHLPSEVMQQLAIRSDNAAQTEHETAERILRRLFLPNNASLVKY